MYKIYMYKTEYPRQNRCNIYSILNSGKGNRVIYSSLYVFYRLSHSFGPNTSNRCIDNTKRKCTIDESY